MSTLERARGVPDWTVTSSESQSLSMAMRKSPCVAGSWSPLVAS